MSMGHGHFFMNESLKERIYNLAHQQNLTVRQIEKDLGWADRSIAKWDKNRPSIDKVRMLADYLGVSIDFILNREDPYATNEDLRMLHDNPDLHILLSASKNLTKEDIDVLSNLARRMNNDL